MLTTKGEGKRHKGARTIKALRCDLNKSLINPGFLGAVLITCALSFTAEAWYNPQNGQSLTVLEALIRLDRETIASDFYLSSIMIFRKALTGYITMFMPIIAAFPFMVSFCTERNTGFMRFSITRSGKWRYYLSKFMSAALSGGLSVMLGVMLFGIFAAVLFPSISKYGIQKETLDMVLPGGFLLSLIKVPVAAFSYGVFSTLPAFFLSSFCKNAYIITCLPFMLDYVRDTFIRNLTEKAFDSGNWEAAQGYFAYSSDAPATLLHIAWHEGRTVLLFNVVLALILLAGFIFILEIRKDKGA